MIFWKYIKGHNNTTGSNPLWSFVMFETRYNSVYADLTRVENIPSLRLSFTNDPTIGSSAAMDLGHFIVQKGKNQTIDERIQLKNGLYVSAGDDVDIRPVTKIANDVCISGTHKLYLNASSNTGSTFIQYQTSGSYGLYFSSASSMAFKVPSTTSSWYFLQNNVERLKITERGVTVLGDGTFTNGIITGSYLSIAYSIRAGGGCDALYFNSTSDRRAKTDIQPLLIDALDLVRKTNLYSFRYKETDTPSIGIIAQDVQDVNINGFKLVDNEEATGKDLDYMTIHESKLTYILWKAVQEQQKLIEELQKEIKELKKN